jgi:TorA maturation chaperone TorD
MKKELLKQLADLTEENDHIGATALVAKELKLEEFETIFESIKRIRATEGFLSPHLCHYSAEKTNEMLEVIQEKKGRKFVEELSRVL